jgi:hypothetical protein
MTGMGMGMMGGPGDMGGMGAPGMDGGMGAPGMTGELPPGSAQQMPDTGQDPQMAQQQSAMQQEPEPEPQQDDDEDQEIDLDNLPTERITRNVEALWRSR